MRVKLFRKKTMLPFILFMLPLLASGMLYLQSCCDDEIQYCLSITVDECIAQCGTKLASKLKASVGGSTKTAADWVQGDFQLCFRSSQAGGADIDVIYVKVCMPSSTTGKIITQICDAPPNLKTPEDCNEEVSKDITVKLTCECIES